MAKEVLRTGDDVLQLPDDNIFLQNSEAFVSIGLASHLDKPVCTSMDSKPSLYARARAISIGKKPKRNIVIERPIYSHNEFDTCQELGERGTAHSPWYKLQRWTADSASTVKSWHPNFHWMLVHFFMTMFPITRWLPGYKVREYLPKDLIAGFTVGIMNIPQGMAYSLLAQLPAVFGLYTSFYPTLLYTLMCTSRHVSFGTFAIVSIMTGNVISSRLSLMVAPENSTAVDPSIVAALNDVGKYVDTRVNIMVTVTIAVGLWQLLLGILGMGNLSVYLSEQLVKGTILGLQNIRQYGGPLKLIHTYINFFEEIHTAHLPTIAVSAVCLTILLLIKHLFNENRPLQAKLPYKFPIPGELVVVVLGSLTSYLMDFSGPKFDIGVVGHIPLGMPAPRSLDFGLFPKIMMDSFGIAIVSFAITISLAKLYADKFHYHVDPNQELRAMGLSNFVSGFFQCIPATGSLGRTAVQTSTGGITQLVSLISCGMVLIVILLLGFLLEPLPKACLASIIMVSLIGLLKQVGQIQQLWKVSAVDTSVFVVSLLGVVLLDVDSGLGLAVGWNLLTVVFRTQRPDVAVLGRCLHTDIYKCIRSYKTTVEISGCKIIRFEAPLYFANAEYFLSQIRHLSGISAFQKKRRLLVKQQQKNHNSITTDVVCISDDIPLKVINPDLISMSTALQETNNILLSVAREEAIPIKAQKEAIAYLIIDCSCISFVDINGIKAIKELAKECSEIGMIMFLASCKADIREFLALSGFPAELGLDRIFVTTHDAVMQATKFRET